MNIMNFCNELKTNGVHTDRQTDRVSCRGASLLKIVSWVFPNKNQFIKKSSFDFSFSSGLKMVQVL